MAVSPGNLELDGLYVEGNVYQGLAYHFMEHYTTKLSGMPVKSSET